MVSKNVSKNEFENRETTNIIVSTEEKSPGRFHDLEAILQLEKL